jgi:sugar lactone lactonase YvrE
MLVSCTVRGALAASAATLLLTGCGAGSRFAPSSNAARIPDGTAAHKTGYNGNVFVSDVANDAVWVCPANFYDIRNGFTFPTGQLFGVSDPVQIAVGSSGTVYVANSLTDASGAGSITEYPRGQTSPSRTLTSGLYSTSGVAVDASGTVFASNKFLGSIEIFPKGKSNPSATITANLTGPDSLAVDKAGDLFIADSSANDVLELVHRAKTPQSLHLSGLFRPTGIAVDSRGTLYVGNLDGAKSNVAVYPAGAKEPSRTLHVLGPAMGHLDSIGEPLMLSIAPGDILIASAFFTLRKLAGQWVEVGPAADGFMPGESRPSWVEYDQNFGASQFIGYDDAVFQPAR